MAVVGKRHRLVIEKRVREQLGVHPGDRAVETVEGGRLVVTFLPARHQRSLRGRLAGPGGPLDFARLRDEGGIPAREPEDAGRTRS